MGEGWRWGSSAQAASGPALPGSLLLQMSQGMSPNVEPDDLKIWSFQGERDLRGLILPSILRRDPRAADLILTSLSFSTFLWKTENNKFLSEGCH